MKFCDFIKAAREKANMSQGDVGKLLGNSSPQYVSNIERGVSHPSQKTLRTMCTAYDINYHQAASLVVVELVAISSQKTKRKYKV